jgi:hypothetical protein
MSENKIILILALVSWACIICILLFLQFQSFKQIKELHKISISQAFEIQQLKEELHHISFASLGHNIPINSKKMVLDNPYSLQTEYYYKLETLLINFSLRDNQNCLSNINCFPQLTNKYVNKLVITNPCGDILNIVKNFPNIEELIIGFNFHVNDGTNFGVCKFSGLKETDLSHIIYPSKIKKIVFIKSDVDIDISSVVSYYTQNNKEVIIDTLSINHITLISEKYYN